MKTTKLISALLMPAMMVACSDEVLEGVNLENNLQADLVEDVTIAVGLNEDVDSRGTFAGDATKGVFGKFYFEPEFADNNEATKATLTDNSSIAGDQVGLCLPSAAANGNIVTNVPFYIAGYQTTPDADGDVTVHTLAKNNSFYGGAESTVAFEEAGETLTYETYSAAVGVLSAGTDLAKGVTNIQKAVFKSVSGIMKGNYVLYYPYNKTLNERGEGKIPATELLSIQTQVTENPTAHVVGEKMFAYAKAPFAVAGGNCEAKNADMGTAAYVFQFKVFSSAEGIGNLEADGNEVKIKMITVSTKDDAKAFGVKGNVTAGTTNTFAADAASAVDLIGVRVTNMTIPLGVEANRTEDEKDDYVDLGSSAYLSTYAIPAQLAGKEIIVRLYDTNGNYVEFNKGEVGSAIKEGSTDYWKLDLNGKTFAKADRLIFNNDDLTTELAKPAGTLILKNNIEEDDVVIPTGFTINGANYSLTLGETSTIEGNVTLNTTLKNTGTLTVKSNGKTGADLVKGDVEVTTLVNNGTLKIDEDATLTATTLTNGGAETETPAKITIAASSNAETYANGKLVATTLNNVAPVAEATGVDPVQGGEITVDGEVASTTINNDGTLTWSADMASTVTVDNNATLDVTAGILAGTITNDKTMNVATGVKATGATITNNGTVNSAGIFTLSGTTTFANNGTINDNGVFSGLSRLTNGTEAEVIRTVSALNNLNIALAEEKLTGIKITGDIAPDAGEDEIVIETTKTLILAKSLTLSTTEESSISNIELAGGTLTGKVATNAIEVSADSNIGAKSTITVDGNITVAATKKLTADDSSYTICTDIEGSYEGPIYVK